MQTSNRLWILVRASLPRLAWPLQKSISRRDGEQCRHGSDKDRAIRSAGCCADGGAEMRLAKDLLHGGSIEDGEVSLARAKVNLAIGNQRRRPNITFHFMSPMMTSSLRLKAKDMTVCIRDEAKATTYRRRAHNMISERPCPNKFSIGRVYTFEP